MVEQIPEELFQQKLDEILSEKDIRFAGFVGVEGNLQKGKFRDDVVPFENDEEQQQVFRELALRISTRKKFDYSMGPVKYSASRREKLVMMSFPLKNMILLITAEPNVNIDRLAYKIIQILGEDWGSFYGE
ncbi:MAG: hypothetical protein GTN35_00555 [Nitrososphaeria archaeon]|nr:hypothetical protein [Nitrosopumilaceae archaeon]NIP10502.1 hypothetical protein [Nitrosopumilaceae archaeon]NIP90912.1 hypothetical protein [Nitrososphaeria archaeon]NIS94528.1 hypothetical protein [Nitrosopumilaceae archaeon]